MRIENCSPIEVIRLVGIVVHQIGHPASRAQRQKGKGDIFALGDHMALEVDGAVERHVGVLILHEVRGHQNVAVGISPLGVQHFLMGGHHLVIIVRVEGDLIQRDGAALISGLHGDPPAAAGRQILQLLHGIQLQRTVIASRHRQNDGVAVMTEVGQLDTGGLLDGQLALGPLALATQIAHQILRRDLQAGKIVLVHRSAVIFPDTQLLLDLCLGGICDLADRHDDIFRVTAGVVNDLSFSIPGVILLVTGHG